jgi:uncharacterized protein (TIGR01777 family)
MIAVLVLMTVQALMGALDNLVHHEWLAGLPREPTARTELALHAVRELLYAVILLTIGWWRWEGAWAYALGAIVVAELGITLWDFVVEDRTRKLPATERVLHTLLCLNYGAVLALWAPELLEWSRAATGFGAAGYGLWSWAMSVCGAGALAFGCRTLYLTARLAVPDWQRHPLRAGASDAPRQVLVTGATGFVGRALVRWLVARGDRVIALSRNAARARDRFGPLVEVVGSLDQIAATRRIDALVHLAGESLVGPWTRARKRAVIDSRVRGAQDLLHLVGRLERAPEVLVSASAIGYYGDRGDALLDETSAPGGGFMAQSCIAVEGAALQARDTLRICCLRIGLVLGRGGGALAPMALASKLGGGAVLGDGRQWLSWIHRADLVRLIGHAIACRELHGAVNAVAPEPVTQRQFADTLAAALNRPRVLRMPAWALRLALGELANLFLVSQQVIPRRVGASDFRFHFPQLADALDDIVGARTPAPAAAVLANMECPVCAFEMNDYARRAQRERCELAVRPISSHRDALKAYGLQELDLRRRLFVVDRGGRVRSGIAACLALWRTIPSTRWRARVVALPGVRHVAELLYDGLIAPGLSRWNEGRGAYKTASSAAISRSTSAGEL